MKKFVLVTILAVLFIIFSITACKKNAPTEVSDPVNTATVTATITTTGTITNTETITPTQTITSTQTVSPTATNTPFCGIQAGTSADNENNAFIRSIIGNAFTATKDAIITTMSFKLDLARTDIAMALYEDNSGVPGNLIAQSAVAATASAGWNTVDITPTEILATHTYWLVFYGDPMMRDLNPGTTPVEMPFLYYSYSGAASSLPANLSSASLGNFYEFKIYASGCDK